MTSSPTPISKNRRHSEDSQFLDIPRITITDIDPEQDSDSEEEAARPKFNSLFVPDNDIDLKASYLSSSSEDEDLEETDEVSVKKRMRRDRERIVNRLPRALSLLYSAINYESIMHRMDGKGLACHRILYSTWFRSLLKIALIILMVLPFLETPSSLTYMTDSRLNVTRPVCPCGILEGFDLAALVVMSMGVGLKLYLFRPFSGLEKNYFVVVEVLCLLISFIDLGVSLAYFCTEQVRVRRFLRVVFLITNLAMTRNTLLGMRRCYKTLAGTTYVGILAFLWCVLILMSLFQFPWTADVDPALYQNFNVGIFQTTYQLFQYMLISNSPDYWFGPYTSNRATAFIMIPIFFLLTLCIVNFFLVVIIKDFKGYFASIMRIRLIKRRIATMAAFEVLKNEADEVSSQELAKLLRNIATYPWAWWKHKILYRIEKRNKNNFSESLDLKNYLYLFKAIDTKSTRRVRKLRARVNELRDIDSVPLTNLQRFFVSQLFAYFGMLATIGSVVGILLNYQALQYSNPALYLNAMYFTWIVEVCLVLEKVCHLWAHGPREYFKYNVHNFDTIMNLLHVPLKIACTVMIAQNTYKWNEVNGPLNLLIRCTTVVCVIRSFRLGLFFERSREICYTLKDIPKNLGPVLVIFYAALYVFSLIGMYSFEGQLNNKTCNTSYDQSVYYTQNFDDFGASLVTMWNLVLLNNVNYVTDKLLCATNSAWPVYFLIIWWFVGFIIILGIIFALIMDTYMYRLNTAESIANSLKKNKRRRQMQKRQSTQRGYTLSLILQAAYDFVDEHSTPKKVPSKTITRLSSSASEVEIHPDLLSDAYLSHGRSLLAIPQQFKFSRAEKFRDWLKKFGISLLKGANLIKETPIITYELRESVYIYGFDAISHNSQDEVYSDEKVPEPDHKALYGALQQNKFLLKYLRPLKELDQMSS